MNGGLSFMSNPRRDNELDRLNLALSSAEMGTWDWDLPTGVIWWDERMHALFGMAPGAFKGSYEEFLGLIHEEDRERIRSEIHARDCGTRRRGYRISGCLAVGRKQACGEDPVTGTL